MHMDRDEKKLEAILKIKYKMLTVKQQKIFLPFSINLDPYVKKVIRDEITSLAATEGMDLVLKIVVVRDIFRIIPAAADFNVYFGF